MVKFSADFVFSTKTFFGGHFFWPNIVLDDFFFFRSPSNSTRKTTLCGLIFMSVRSKMTHHACYPQTLVNVRACLHFPPEGTLEKVPCRRPSDVRRMSVGRPTDVCTDVRWTSVGRPSDVRRTSVGRPYGRPYGRPSDVHRTSIRWTSVGRLTLYNMLGYLPAAGYLLADGEPASVSCWTQYAAGFSAIISFSLCWTLRFHFRDQPKDSGRLLSLPMFSYNPVQK